MKDVPRPKMLRLSESGFHAFAPPLASSVASIAPVSPGRWTIAQTTVSPISAVTGTVVTTDPDVESVTHGNEVRRLGAIGAVVGVLVGVETGVGLPVGVRVGVLVCVGVTVAVSVGVGGGEGTA